MRGEGGEARLDPVRWRPGRRVLIGLTTVAALAAFAAVAAPPTGIDGIPGSEKPAAPTGSTGPSPGRSGTAAGPPMDDPRAGPADGGRSGREVPEGRVGVPVRLAEPAALALLRPGDVVDLLRIDDRRAPARVAAAAVVLEVTNADDPISGALLLALRPAEADRAVTVPGGGFAVVLRPG